MLYIVIFIFITRTIYVIYHNYTFDKFNKDISGFLLSQNLHLKTSLWESSGKYASELPVNLSDIEYSKRFELVCKPIISKDTPEKIDAFVFTWKKRLSNFDILMGYNMTHKKIGSIRLDKSEIRDKNIERLLQ